MSRPRRVEGEESTMFSLRMTLSEKAELHFLMRNAEKAAGLTEGTLTLSGYARSVLLKHIAASRAVEIRSLIAEANQAIARSDAKAIREAADKFDEFTARSSGGSEQDEQERGAS